tara:strand:- start:30855 stop:31412 length:558 start_codon:yes stop_codon:yes gene_type:complete
MDLIEGGFKVLDQFGLEKFSTNKVAEVTGVSIGSIYQYFSNKEELLLRMIEVTTTDILVEVTQKMNSLEFENPQDFVNVFVFDVYSLFMKRKSIGHMLFLSGRNEIGLLLIKKSREEFISKLIVYYNERFPIENESEKQSRKQTLEVLVISFMGLVQAIILEKKTKKEADSLMLKFSHLARAAVS